MPLSASSFRTEDVGLMDVWAVAAVTANTDLMAACFPLICTHFDDLRSDERFLHRAKAEELIELMGKMDKRLVTEESKLQTIAAWMNTHERDVRAEQLADLLATLDISRLSPIFMFDLGTGAVDLQLPDQCLSMLLKTWRESKKFATRYTFALNHPPFFPVLLKESLFWVLTEPLIGVW